MKVIAFLGSPNKNGNTAQIVNKILKSAEASDAETQVFMQAILM
jgi:multimeric flavodoxin WrbA